MKAETDKISIESKKIEGVAPKKFKGGKHEHHSVRIFLGADKHILEKIDIVKYSLHPTFRQRVRIAEDRSSQFEIKIWTYGYFDILATVYFLDGEVRNIRGYVKW